MEPLQENAIAIIGVGYVGLPLALSLAKFHPKVLGYDLDNERAVSYTHLTLPTKA